MYATLTDALRLELAPWRIRVILIEPAGIRTDAVDKLDRDVRSAKRNFGPEGRALYGEAFRQMATRALAREAHGSHPDVVAAVVSRAVHAPRPRTRYLAGKDGQVLAAVARLPAPVLDRVRRRFFGLPRRGSAERAAPARDAAWTT